jgi:hypothetical protein
LTSNTGDDGLARGTSSYAPASQAQLPPGNRDPELDTSYWFHHAALPLYGLPSGARGQPEMGSVSLSRTDTGGYQADRLTLAHRFADGSRILVATHRAATSHRFIEIAAVADLKRLIAGQRHRTGSLTDHRQQARKAGSLLAQAHWTDEQLTIDAEPTDFRMITIGRDWTAYGYLSEFIIQVTAVGVARSTVSLITIDDLSQYIGC